MCAAVESSIVLSKRNELKSQPNAVERTHAGHSVKAMQIYMTFVFFVIAARWTQLWLCKRSGRKCVLYQGL